MTNSFTDVDVAVVGAGIGGLAAVLALRAAGIDAHAYERTPAIAPLGASVMIRPRSLELMRRWVDLTEFERVRCVVDTMEFRTADGTFIRTTPVIGEPGDPGWGNVVHRADLFDTLRSGVPRHALHLGRETTAVSGTGDLDDHAEIHFADGDSVRARAVIGADGIRSTVRAMLAIRDEPVFSGMVIYRSVVPATALGDLPNDRIRVWMREDRSFWAFPIRGGRQVSYSATVMSGLATEESWTTVVDPATVVSGMVDFDPLVRRIVAAGTGPAIAYAINDRDPVTGWSAGRVTLLGDAAHPMLPFQGQGANQAIQDAAVLAETLALALHTGADVPTALRAYEAICAPRTTHFQHKSRHRWDLDKTAEPTDDRATPSDPTREDMAS